MQVKSLWPFYTRLDLKVCGKPEDVVKVLGQVWLWFLALQSFAGDSCLESAVVGLPTVSTGEISALA